MKSWFCFFIVLLASSSALAETKLTSLQSPETADLPRNQVVGNLPYSNQWVYDKRQSFLYLTLNRGSLASNSMRIGDYTSTFSSSDFNFPSVDYFTKLFGLTSAESSSFLRGFSIWARYSLGFGWRQGQLGNDAFAVSTDSENAYLIAGMMRVGPLLCFDALTWIQPFAGFEISPFAYRHSSSLTGSEAQGGGALYGPVAGLHLPIFFEHRASVYAEVRRNNVLSDERNIFGASTNLDFGMGLVF